MNPILWAVRGLAYLAVYLAWCVMGLAAWSVLALFTPWPPCPIGGHPPKA
jgi:hypothetical protein